MAAGAQDAGVLPAHGSGRGIPTQEGIAMSITPRNSRNVMKHATISSFHAFSGKCFAEAVRGHWSTENRLHWWLDVTFQEDQCRIRLIFESGRATASESR